MKRIFIEVASFTRKVDTAGRDLLIHIQTELLERLESGRVVQDSGGLRKLRVADPWRGKGKRGGFRVLYLDIPEVQCAYLIGLFSKDEKDDLSSGERKAMKHLVDQIKREVG